MRKAFIYRQRHTYIYAQHSLPPDPASRIMEMFSDRICSVCCIIIISCFTDAKVTVYLIYQKENAIFLLSTHTIYQNESRMATPGTPVSEKCVHRHVCAPGHALQKASGITRSVSRHPFGEEGYTSSPASRDMDRRDAGYGQTRRGIWTLVSVHIPRQTGRHVPSQTRLSGGKRIDIGKRRDNAVAACFRPIRS